MYLQGRYTARYIRIQVLQVHYQHIASWAPLVELLLLQGQVLFRHFVFIGLEVEEIR